MANGEVYLIQDKNLAIYRKYGGVKYTGSADTPFYTDDFAGKWHALCICQRGKDRTGQIIFVLINKKKNEFHAYNHINHISDICSEGLAEGIPQVLFTLISVIVLIALALWLAPQVTAFLVEKTGAADGIAARLLTILIAGLAAFIIVRLIAKALKLVNKIPVLGKISHFSVCWQVWQKH